VTRKLYPLLHFPLGVAASVAVYDRLPDPIAVHWDLEGNPNGWMPRPVGAFFAPVFLLVMWAVMLGLPRLGSQRADGESPARDGAYETIVAATLLLLLATHAIVLAIALGHRVPIGRVVPVLLGALFVVLGLALPRTRPNRWVGIRTAATLSSERVWTRTHRLAGRGMLVAGIVTIAAALLLPAWLALPVFVAAIVASTVAPVVYAWRARRREEGR
jgi:uncharacterized membrane protein